MQKDEIKENLETINDLIKIAPDKGSYAMSHKMWKQLLDYITNLQEKVEWYENIEINKTIDKFRLEHNKEIKRLQEENEDYKSSCENATVILNNIYLLDNVSITNNAVEEIDKAINILQGVGKDE